MIDAFDLALIAFCIVMETFSALCFKRGVDDDAANAQDKGFVLMVATSPLLWVGIALWGVELAAWIVVLERTPLSIAFPIMSLVYCSVPLAGKWRWWAAHENLPVVAMPAMGGAAAV
jgi:hypothetical protein